MARNVLWVIVIIELILILCAFLVRNKEEIFKFLTFATNIIASLAMTVTILFPEQVASVIYPDIDTYVSENQLLKEENASLSSANQLLEEQYKNIASERDKLEEDVLNLEKAYENRDYAEISHAKLVINGLENSSILNKSVAIINGKEYYDSNVIGSITGLQPSYEKTDKIIYWGEQKRINSFAFSDVSDILYNGQVFWKYTLSEGDSFSVAGKEYSVGFVIGCDRSLFGEGDGYALFDLENKYSEMSFDVGKTDDYEIQDVTLKIFLDGEETEQYELSGESSSTHLTVELNYAKDLKIQIIGGSRVKYGFYNIVPSR